MIDVECPWCAGPATVEVADGDEFSCAGCAVRVEIVGRPGSPSRSPAPPEDASARRRVTPRAAPRPARTRALTAATAMPISAIVDRPAGRVDQRAADEQADRLQAERDRPGRAPDPPQQLIRRICGPQRDVRHEHHGLGDAGDQRGGDLDRDPTVTATDEQREAHRRGCRR